MKSEKWNFGVVVSAAALCGFILGVLVTDDAPTECAYKGQIFCVLKDWQTLIAGLIAFSGAFVTVNVVRIQIRQTENAEKVRWLEYEIDKYQNKRNDAQTKEESRLEVYRMCRLIENTCSRFIRIQEPNDDVKRQLTRELSGPHGKLGMEFVAANLSGARLRSALHIALECEKVAALYAERPNANANIEELINLKTTCANLGRSFRIEALDYGDAAQQLSTIIAERVRKRDEIK